eukprot:226631_1
MTEDKIIGIWTDEYPELLDIFIDFVNKNENNSQPVRYRCNDVQCDIFQRLFENKTSYIEDSNTCDQLFVFYRNLLDTIHVCIAHQNYIRSSQYHRIDTCAIFDQDENHNEEKEVGDNDYVSVLQHYHDNILKTCGRRHRFSVHQNNGKTKHITSTKGSKDEQKKNEKQQQNKKQNSNTDHNEIPNDKDKNDSDGNENNQRDENNNDNNDDENTYFKDNNKQRKVHDTFLDGLCKFMKQKQMKSTKTLYKYLKEEQYDSDALFNDIEHGYYEYNIAKKLQNANEYAVIVNYVCCKQVSHFCGGYIFYYWEWYKYGSDSTFAVEHDYYWNRNDHSGYKLHQLYVSSKYDNIKQEVTQNKIETINIFAFKIAFTKSNKYTQSEKSKNIKAVNQAFPPFLRYNIPENTPISQSHLLAVILYCDSNELCCAFSATFRIANPRQTLSYVHKQNQEFANWSRLLRETVEIFGCGSVKRNKFYCGMSVPMVLEEFNIRLCAPTSTSAVVEVANRFGGDSGVVIELSNNGYKYAHRLRMFDCSWISKHAHEYEVLFMGGFQRIKIETIRMLFSNQNYHTYIKALFYFHCMLGGTIMDKTTADIDENDCKILKNLINHRLDIDGFRNKYPAYINYCFTSFVLHQTQIVINLEQIDKYFQQLRDLIINEDKLPREDLCMLCPNIKSIIIYSGYKEINLVSLLSWMHQSSRKYDKNNMRITVKANWVENQRSWLYQQQRTRAQEISTAEMDYELIIHKFTSIRLSPNDFHENEETTVNRKADHKVNREDSVIIEKVSMACI